MSRSESEEREGDEELVPETPAPVQIRDCTVLQGADLVADPDYPVGSFEVPADDPSANPLSVALIAVATVEDRVVVAVPFAAWHRTVLRRVLPPGALARPLPLSVDLVDRSTEGGEHPFLETAKIWIGTLAASAEDSVFFDPNGVLDAPDFPFSTQSPSSLPSATSLEAAFQQHFAFVSATSGASGGGGGRATASGGDAVSARLQQLEQSVQSIASSLQQLTRGGTPLQAGQETCPPPPGLPSPKPAARKKTEGSQPSLPPGANMDIVNSARQAGVPEKQIREMLELAMKGRSKLPDFPAADGRKSRKNILSETEDEEEDAGEPGLPGGDPLAAAVTKLTEIASHLTLERKKSRTLESILEGAGSAGMSETTGSSSSRRQAAALRALRSALQKQPEAISRAIEKNMEEDFGKATQMPGSSAVNVSARAWLELRARVQGYQTPVRFLWAVAGVLDAIRAERHQEARARCGLILAMGDQMSIDRGSWVVAGEIGLEDPPPMASFNSHTLPSEAEPPYTKLIDGRWMELILSKLSDVDSLNEKKKKLAGRRATTTTTSETELPKPNPKRKGGGKGDKGKSAAGGDKAPAAENQ